MNKHLEIDANLSISNGDDEILITDLNQQNLLVDFPSHGSINRMRRGMPQGFSRKRLRQMNDAIRQMGLKVSLMVNGRSFLELGDERATVRFWNYIYSLVQAGAAIVIRQLQQLWRLISGQAVPHPITR